MRVWVGVPAWRLGEEVGVAWNTANDAIIAEGKRALIDDPARFDGVTVLEVDEHCWRHTRGGDKFVTVIINLTPVAQGTGPARLDMVEGRSKQVFKRWLSARPAAWRTKIKIEGDGWVHRLQDRRRGTPRLGSSDGPVPRRTARRRGCRHIPPTRPTRHVRPQGPPR